MPLGLEFTGATSVFKDMLQAVQYRIGNLKKMEAIPLAESNVRT
jgi:hypothetical protein